MQRQDSFGGDPVEDPQPVMLHRWMIALLMISSYSSSIIGGQSLRFSWAPMFVVILWLRVGSIIVICSTQNTIAHAN